MKQHPANSGSPKKTVLKLCVYCTKTDKLQQQTIF